MTRYTNWHYSKKNTLKKYLSLRGIDNFVLINFANYIIKIALLLKKNPQIKELGVGNGRMFIPIIKQAAKKSINTFHFEVADDSKMMLADLKLRLQKIKAKNKFFIKIIKEDLQIGSVKKKKFDLIYTFAVFHILNNWEYALEKMYNQLKEGGIFIYGKEINQVFHGTEKIIREKNSPDLISMVTDKEICCFFDKYHALREKYGVPFIVENKEILYSNNTNLVKYLLNKNMKLSIISNDNLLWFKSHTIKEMIHAFEFAQVTTFGSEIPDQIRCQIASELKAWVKSKKISLTKQRKIPAKLQLYIFKK